MLYALSWILVLILLAAWSLGIAVLHSVLTWSMTGVGAIADHAQRLEHVALPGWVAAWLPADVEPMLRAGLASGLPWIESAISVLPSAAHWLDPLAWLVWGLGFVVLAIGGLLLHALISMTRRLAGPQVVPTR